jgi:HSP20 family protein
MKKKIVILVTLLVLMVGLSLAISASATDDKIVSLQNEASQVLSQTKEALKNLKNNGSSDDATVAILENSIKKLENLTDKLAKTELSQARPVLGSDVLKSSFNADEWNPLQEMEAMQNQMNQLFGEAFGRFDRSTNFNNLMGRNGFSPNMNVTDDEKQFIITVDLPGTSKDDVEIQLKDQLLTIKGSTIEKKEVKDDQNHIFKSERFNGIFTRSITLPSPVKSDGMVSKLTNGILEIRIPKA